uniref:Reverse transcriptase/retrotransposon-derived protein RNase H-like domain-containing protein n=1 Tax=Fagus sylvatica TaxID=28930 RepID=A0A2N9GGQ7_FAGSY
MRGNIYIVVVPRAKRVPHKSVETMEGVNNEGISTDPPMTPIERQMQVIATSIQDLARETMRQSQELWQAIRKEPPTPPRPLGDDQPPPQGENMREDQETDEPSRGCPPTHLLNVKQIEGESLRAYVHRFNKEALQIDRLTAFMAGLRKGDFLYDLCKDPSETLSELMYEAQKHMNTEDTIESRDDPPPKRRKDVDNCKQEPAKQKVPKFSETPVRKKTITPAGKFSSFTPLNTPIDQLLMQIQDDPSLRWPETLIRQGKLQKYVSRPSNTHPPKAPGPKEPTENHRPGPVGEIRTIIGGPTLGGTSCASRKAYARQVHNILVVQRPPKNVRLDDQIISFSEEDVRGTHQPHDDALVITMNVAGFTTRRVMVDNGSSADILYLPAYQQMKFDKDKLRPMDAPLVGFTGDKVCLVDIVTLPITIGTYSKIVSKTVDFLIVNWEVRGDQVVARECYLASLGSEWQNQTMTIEEQKTLVKPSEELDTINLEEECPEKATKVGANLLPQMKESIVQILKNNKDVFAWSHEDMPGIDPSIISHKLNVNPSLRLVKQKRRVFAPERNDTIMEEVDKLLAANFIKEVFYPNWLANVVMVKKNQWEMRGIKANSDKIKAILDMQPPKTTKEVQGLTGRVAALNRFVSRSTDKCLPFSKTLKKAFTWTDECQQAFEELKSYLTTPLLLSPSKQGEELYLYLVVSPTTVSSALVREENRWQLPIYYTSRALRGAEERYSPMEKLSFALITASRKLRPYFQAHTIVVLTNHPLRKAMSKPDAARRLIQWSIELSEFDVNYRPRTAIKAQTLADFMVEFTVKDNKPKEEEERDASRWTIHTYGSSTKNAGGVGIILKSPEGDVIKRAIRLQYTTTKNEVEYEALLTRLKMARTLEQLSWTSIAT